MQNLNPEAPVDLDKNYQVKWLVKDSILFLYDIEILDGAENYPDRFKTIEDFTGKDYTKNYYLSLLDKPILDKYQGRILPASWFTGFIIVKRQPEHGETYCNCMYRMEDNKVLFFINGHLKYVND